MEDGIAQLNEDLTNEHVAAREKKKQLEKEIVCFCTFYCQLVLAHALIGTFTLFCTEYCHVLNGVESLVSTIFVHVLKICKYITVIDFL